MYGICSTDGKSEACTKFWLESLKGRNHLEDLGIDRMDLMKIGWKGVNWIHPAQDRGRGGSCDHGGKPSRSIKDGEFIGYEHFTKALLPGISRMVGWLVGWLVKSVHGHIYNDISTLSDNKVKSHLKQCVKELQRP
jgi:hypothetical protein